MGAVKSGFDFYEGFPYEPSSNYVQDPAGKHFL